MCEVKASTPGWLYDGACCDKWTPADGCTAGHTGRPAMSRDQRDFADGYCRRHDLFDCPYAHG